MIIGLCYNLKHSIQGLKEVDKFSTDLDKPLPEDFFAECDTMETIGAVRDALSERHEVLMIEADNNAFEKFRRLRPQIVFNIAEGLFGASRESQIPAMLDMLRIPYTGSDPLTLGICLNKARAKEVLSYYGIPTAPFDVIHYTNNIKLGNLEFPLIVKPLWEGSSKGIKNTAVVTNEDEFRKVVTETINLYDEPVIVEKYLPGREFTVAMIGNGENVEVLPIVEMKFDTLPEGVNPIYSYEAKWIWDTTDKPLEIFQCPADISLELKEKIEIICKRTYQVLNCKDWSRIDVRLDGNGEPNILEINPLPGILPKPEDNSCFPKSSRTRGMTYNQMINRVLDEAIKRYKLFE
jgi:D-alanine-D-alanine ligase